MYYLFVNNISIIYTNLAELFFSRVNRNYILKIFIFF